ncbi:MAG: beta-lactamase [Bacillota bacterium]|nr:MAG: beta-lactamase [Bacillota bacterium]
MANSKPQAALPYFVPIWLKQMNIQQKGLEQQAFEQTSFAQDVEEMFARLIQARTAQGHTGVIGVYVKELYSGNTYYGVKSHLGEAEGLFETASTVKLLAALAVYKGASKGEIDLKSTIADQLLGFRGELDWAIRRMLTHSVNEYYNMFLRAFGVGEINAVLQEAGLFNTVVKREIMPSPEATPATLLQRYGTLEPNTTTPENFGHLLELIYRGEFLGPELSRKLFTTLQNTIYNSRIPQGINFEVPVAHKTGTAAGVTNDAALVCLKDNPYIIVIMTRDAYSGTTDFQRQLAKTIHNYMKIRSPYAK